MSAPRPTDDQLVVLLMTAYGLLDQHGPLNSSHTPFIQATKAQLQKAWEGLSS